MIKKISTIVLILLTSTTLAFAGQATDEEMNSKLGSIKTAVEALDNSISGNETQVDIVSIAAGNTNIGDVDVASIAAGTNVIGDVGNPTSTSTLVDAVTLDDSPTSVTATGVAVQDKNKIAFYVNYDETEVGGVSAAFTIEVSYDNSVWIVAGFYDVAGGATIQTSESFTADANYVCWMPRELVAPYIRVKVTATGSDADDIVLTSVKMATQE